MKVKSKEEIRDEVNKKTSLITKTKREYKINNVSYQVKNGIDYLICQTLVGDIRIEMYK
jgi:hypothetical protein